MQDLCQTDPVPEQSPYGVRSCPGGRIGAGSPHLLTTNRYVENPEALFSMCNTGLTETRVPNCHRMVRVPDVTSG